MSNLSKAHAINSDRAAIRRQRKTDEWNAAGSLDEIAKAWGIPLSTARSRASVLRKQGFALKYMGSASREGVPLMLWTPLAERMPPPDPNPPNPEKYLFAWADGCVLWTDTLDALRGYHDLPTHWMYTPVAPSKLKGK